MVWLRDAGRSTTGMLTSPKVMAPFQMMRDTMELLAQPGLRAAEEAAADRREADR